MTNSKRKFTNQEKERYLAEFKALQEAEHVTVDGFAARAGLSKHTFSHWLYNRHGNKPGALVKVGNAALPVAAPHTEVRIEYFGATIRTDLDHLSSVLGIIRNA